MDPERDVSVPRFGDRVQQLDPLAEHPVRPDPEAVVLLAHRRIGNRRDVGGVDLYIRAPSRTSSRISSFRISVASANASNGSG
jgi:hypothetical protein